jgi:hypothetical protein
MSSNQLFIKKGRRNYMVLVGFSIILFFSLVSLSEVHFPLHCDEYFIVWVLHIIQYILILVFFRKDFYVYHRNKKHLYWNQSINYGPSIITVIVNLLSIGLIYFVMFLLKESCRSKEYYFYFVLYNVVTLFPISYLLLTKFIFVNNQFDDEKLNNRINSLKKLKNSGTISDEEFAKRIKELEYLKIKSKIHLSEDYLSMKKDADNGGLTYGELEDYVENEIKKILDRVS